MNFIPQYLVDHLKYIKNSFSRHNGSVHASAFAFNTILSLPALLLFLIFLVKTLFWSSDFFRSYISNIATSLPWDTGQLIQQFLEQDFEIQWFWIGIFTITLLFWSGTKLISTFILSVNNSFGLMVDPTSTNFLYTIKTHFIWLLFILLFLTVIWASLVFENIVALLFSNTLLISFLNFGTSLVIYTILYAFLLRFMILLKLSMKSALLGWFFMSVITVISIIAMSIIFSFVDFGSKFATWASIIVFMLWIQYLALLLYLGFEIISYTLKLNWSFIVRKEGIKKHWE
jgi:membrane protein